VVEPLLRWMLVEKGYALVHGACLAVNGRAYLVTARTDTGKTTTLLQILCNRAGNETITFVADDMIVLRRDGRVYNFPKPLTISAHTVRAIHGAPLAWYERVFLPLQSRIHSRRGRVFAHWLARSTLPVATLNAYVQCLIPPPKYTIEQLVPGIETASAAQLARIFVIERGPDLDTHLSPPDALNVLLDNCEDASGFPPYPALEPFLRQSREAGDLGQLEAEIIASASRTVSARLIRQPEGDWWPKLMRDMQAAPADKLPAVSVDVAKLAQLA